MRSAGLAVLRSGATGSLIGVYVTVSQAAIFAVISITGFDFGAAGRGQDRRAAARSSRQPRPRARPQLSFVHAYGEPATELLRVAHASRADLVIVGNPPRRSTGSLARRLITKDDSPIVIVVP
jgi:nucleotide-binding universal stress UspA family protein